MIKHLTTANGASFVYDANTLSEVNQNLIANFIMLRAEKTIRTARRKSDGKEYNAMSYEYSSKHFKNMPMCNIKSVVTDVDADSGLINLYQLISTGKKLTDEDREYLRDNYLVVIDLRTEE